MNLAARSTATLALLSAVLVPIASVNAATLTFQLDGAEGNPTFSETVGGVTLTLSNSNFGYLTDASSDGAGLFIANEGGTLRQTSFDLKFDQSVTLVSYFISQVALSPSPGTFTIGTASGLGTTTGSHSFTGVFTTTPNVNATFNASINSHSGQFYLQSITVTTVPEPTEWAVIGAAACLGVGLALRRRQGK